MNICNFILAASDFGFIWLLLLFLFCFAGVHIARLAAVGWIHSKKQKPTPPPEKPQEKKAPAATQEPVYYIVERKKRRVKTNYTEPREIRFK